MLYSQKLLAEFERKRATLHGYQSQYGERLRAFRDALGSLGARFPSAASLSAAQDALSHDQERQRSLGARPTAEYDRWRAPGGAGIPALPFGRQFAHHEEAREWAECLRGITTFAVDGSQLPPWRDASIPVGLVQAGLFENPHQQGVPYLKDVELELLSPDELQDAESESAEARAGEAISFSTQIVNLRRFELEAQTLVRRMEHHARTQRGKPSASVVGLYDGSLIVSFALKMPPHYRHRYVQASRKLLMTSRDTGVPLVGYIDTSYARGVVTMLAGLSDSDNLYQTRGVHDALLWQNALAWGDRSPAFISAREDLGQMGYADQQADVAFVYLKAAHDRPPVRLEFPRWILDAGLLDDVMTVIRAEIVAGTGYPYPIESADSVAVIQAPDRAQFYALFQQFAGESGLEFTFSRKALSKSRRRL